MSRLGQPDVSRSSVVGPLAPLWAGFAADLERRGYAPSTAAPYLRRCAQLSGWMEAQGLQTWELSPAVIERFFAARRAAGYRDYVSLRGITPLLGYLRAAGLCPAAPVPSGPVDELLDRFGGWLGRERHLAPSSVATYVCHARALVERLLGPDRVELERLDAAAVRRFVLDVCPRRGRASAKLTVVAVRQLLRFLYVEGELDRPLAEAVPSVSGARLSGLPKRLAPSEVTRLLDSCDRGTPAGRRDLAMLTLMARLGVRIGEVAGLSLDDIDWRAGEIAVCGKGRSQRLPLPDAVGDAIAGYLHDRRPTNAESRTVFLTALAPYRAIGRSAVCATVVRASQRAGLGRVNAHRLRHTLASEMLATGADLPAIGQVLGHRMLDTTAVYAKCDRDTLRQIARAWPGGSS